MTRSRASARAAGTRFERAVADYLATHVDDRIDRRVGTGVVLVHDGKRYCRTCRRERNRAAQERRKAATA